jgi:clan AA aspartic protease
VKAWIDEENRATIEVWIANHAKSNRQAVNAWIDTAFDGHLVLRKSEVERLDLGVLADTTAILADGSKGRLRCYYCVVDWMGSTVPVQVVENSGSLPLLGLALLSSADLRINYRERTCTVS